MTNKEFDAQQLFGFYGSLRQNEGNWDYFLKNKPGVKYLGTHVIKGFDLYSLGSYPVALASEDKSHTLTIDVFQVVNDGSKSGIDGMEIGAGYQRRIVEVTGPDGEIMPVLIYTGSDRYRALHENRRLPDGDWSKRKTHYQTNAE